MKTYKWIFIFFLLPAIGLAQLQHPPFWNDIQAFKKQDSIDFPGKGKILFIGSSSFTKWKDVQEYFPGYPIINRGFGGSTLTDLIRYEKEIIFPYRPKQVVIYCGENDVAASDTVTGRIVFKRFKKLFTDIRAKFPHIPVIFISLKPSPSRWSMKDRMLIANQLIQKYLEQKKKAVFISVWENMLGKDGEPIPEIFLEDKLHMNAKGYAIWEKLIEPNLLK
ncbi:MAG: G-D-S-L family lipolytic protein [Bacteroidetes bacterium]|nr:G-D-S-L family lipolytic protein [Bacteroidota bacterium]MBS1930287.1 G-D-S-L family lipolytic protein [Bacteroidota bacterium]